MNNKEVIARFSATPDLFAQITSGGAWKRYRWVEYLSDRITPSLYTGGARFLITAPPQHGKSQFISNRLPTWFLYRFRTRKVILASYAQSYAEKWGATVRDNLLSERVGVPLKIDSQAKRRFMLREGGQMITAGIGGPVTGEGADLFIVDDPFKNYEEAMSARIRERNLDWFRTVATTRMQPGGSIIILHTRWHESDLIGSLAKEPGWTLINLPAVAGENDLMGRAPGEALCPERYDETELKRIRREVKEIPWSALYQGEPVQQGGNIIRGDWIQRYTELPKMDEVAIFADLSYKEGEANDFTVVEAWGRKGANIYLIAQIRDQMGFSDQLCALERMFNTYPEAFHKEIEEKANGAAIIETVKSLYPGVEANNPRTEKSARLASVAPLYHAGNVWYPDEQKEPWIKTNIDEITKFPKAEHDDTVDVASMAVAYFGRMASSLRALEALSKR
jgi:predicted phage terminase large subunit-like protein